VGARAARWLECRGPSAVDPATLEAALESAVAEVTAQFPDLPIDEERLVGHLARHAHGDDAIEALKVIRMPELALALACADGQPAALAILERDYMGSALAGLAQLRLDEAQRDEVIQALRAKLFGGDVEPGISKFAATGSLAGWLRTAATRIALNRRRGAKRRQAREEVWFAEQLLVDTDPELEFLKERYRVELEEAMTLAFERLAGDQRELLRRYIVQGASLQDLADAHSVDPSTISRWLSRIRSKLAEDARRHFAQACALEPSECESLVRLVKSDMHVSVLRLLNTP
jgi:RNA polymerase sigma-70 factor, ECF subfamily